MGSDLSKRVSFRTDYKYVIWKDDWIKEYDLAEGNVDVTAVDPELVTIIPSATQMGKVYQRLVYDTMQPGEESWLEG